MDYRAQTLPHGGVVGIDWIILIEKSHLLATELHTCLGMRYQWDLLGESSSV